jgi:hypothetical protein
MGSRERDRTNDCVWGAVGPTPTCGARTGMIEEVWGEGVLRARSAGKSGRGPGVLGGSHGAFGQGEVRVGTGLRGWACVPCFFRLGCGF